MTLTYGSVCSGIEAATQAWHPLGWTAKFFSEIDTFPSEVLAHHYGSNMPGAPLAENGIPNHGDFTKIPASAGPVDLLVGGTPCQSFSVAGKRLGLDDPRGNLALEFLGLAQRLGAGWIVWENVPGVLSSFSDAPESEGGPRSALAERAPEDEWYETHDFGTFLSFVQECGYGFAYRVLDAQHVRTQRFPRAVPQRRRRVILVGYLGDWRRAAAVLFEPEGLCGDPAPRRETGQGPAGTVSARTDGGGGLGTDFDLVGGLQAFGGGNTTGPIDVSTALTAHGVRQDFDVETFVAGQAPPVTANPYADNDAREGLRGEGFDASEDGTGRGTPIVPIAFDSKASIGPEVAAVGHLLPIAFSGCDDGGDATPGVAPTIRIGSGKKSGGGQQLALAYDMRGRKGGSVPEGPHDTANIRAADGGSSRSYIASPWSVRRLTPAECARLQGFPDDFCRIPRNGKPASECPDGPQYKAYGNSMAVNVMDWVGQRIDAVERLIQEGRI